MALEKFLRASEDVVWLYLPTQAALPVYSCPFVRLQRGPGFCALWPEILLIRGGRRDTRVELLSDGNSSALAILCLPQSHPSYLPIDALRTRMGGDDWPDDAWRATMCMGAYLIPNPLHYPRYLPSYCTYTSHIVLDQLQ